MRVYGHYYLLVVFCTTNSSQEVARERWQSFENSNGKNSIFNEHPVARLYHLSLLGAPLVLDKICDNAGREAFFGAAQFSLRNTKSTLTPLIHWKCTFPTNPHVRLLVRWSV